jgi:hypothetical protein
MPCPLPRSPLTSTRGEPLIKKKVKYHKIGKRLLPLPELSALVRTVRVVVRVWGRNHTADRA